VSEGHKGLDALFGGDSGVLRIAPAPRGEESPHRGQNVDRVDRQTTIANETTYTITEQS
jgi:hypothetical protein